MPPKTSELQGDEWALLREQVATIQSVVRRRYSGVFAQTLDDLVFLQRLLDDGIYDDTHVDELKAMGTVLGNVLERQLGFVWVAVLDEQDRREAGLLYRATKPFTVLPQRIITGRVAAGTKFELSQIFRELKSDVARAQFL
jgi:hypothetical protein